LCDLGEIWFFCHFFCHFGYFLAVWGSFWSKELKSSQNCKNPPKISDFAVNR